MSEERGREGWGKGLRGERFVGKAAFLQRKAGGLFDTQTGQRKSLFLRGKIKLLPTRVDQEAPSSAVPLLPLHFQQRV